MDDECKTAFIEWAKPYNGYGVNLHWEAWQAAWNARSANGDASTRKDGACNSDVHERLSSPLVGQPSPAQQPVDLVDDALVEKLEKLNNPNASFISGARWNAAIAEVIAIVHQHQSTQLAELRQAGERVTELEDALQHLLDETDGVILLGKDHDLSGMGGYAKARQAMARKGESNEA